VIKPRKKNTTGFCLKIRGKPGGKKKKKGRQLLGPSVSEARPFTGWENKNLQKERTHRRCDEKLLPETVVLGPWALKKKGVPMVF